MRIVAESFEPALHAMCSGVIRRSDCENGGSKRRRFAESSPEARAPPSPRRLPRARSAVRAGGPMLTLGAPHSTLSSSTRIRTSSVAWGLSHASITGVRFLPVSTMPLRLMSGCSFRNLRKSWMSPLRQMNRRCLRMAGSGTATLAHSAAAITQPELRCLGCPPDASLGRRYDRVGSAGGHGGLKAEPAPHPRLRSRGVPGTAKAPRAALYWQPSRQIGQSGSLGPRSRSLSCDSRSREHPASASPRLPRR